TGTRNIRICNDVKELKHNFMTILKTQLAVERHSRYPVILALLFNHPTLLEQFQKLGTLKK
ncbi:MAG: hypothetical protein AAF960_17235, partial [Bacteroidota bacterium]